MDHSTENIAFFSRKMYAELITPFYYLLLNLLTYVGVNLLNSIVMNNPFSEKTYTYTLSFFVVFPVMPSAIII